MYMSNLNEIIEWNDCGSEHRIYVKHYYGKDEKLNIHITYEDVTHDKVTEINIPPQKIKPFLTSINGSLLSRKYQINI